MSDIDSSSPGIRLEPTSNNAASEPWRALVGQIGEEVAGPLSAAMERIHILTGTGRIDRRGLRALRNEVDAARQVGLVSQQIARLASGIATQTPEQLQLVPILKGVFAQRSRDIESRGTQIRQLLQPAEIMADAPLLFSLLNTLLDWTLANARSHVEFRTDIKIWPAHARLSAHFAQIVPEKGAEREAGIGLDSLIWRLLQQTASTMGLTLSRHVDDTHTELVIEFPQTVNVQTAKPEPAPMPTPPEPASPVGPAPLAALNLKVKPLIGSHVLVAAGQREVRLQVREAIRNMGLIVDFVNTMEEAEDFCRDGLPHALVYESALTGATFDRLKVALISEAPEFVLIELVRTGSDSQDSDTPRVGEDSIGKLLALTLVEELSRTM